MGSARYVAIIPESVGDCPACRNQRKWAHTRDSASASALLHRACSESLNEEPAEEEVRDGRRHRRDPTSMATSRDLYAFVAVFDLNPESAT